MTGPIPTMRIRSRTGPRPAFPPEYGPRRRPYRRGSAVALGGSWGIPGGPIFGGRYKLRYKLKSKALPSAQRLDSLWARGTAPMPTPLGGVRGNVSTRSTRRLPEIENQREPGPDRYFRGAFGAFGAFGFFLLCVSAFGAFVAFGAFGAFCGCLGCPRAPGPRPGRPAPGPGWPGPPAPGSGPRAPGPGWPMMAPGPGPGCSRPRSSRS